MAIHVALTHRTTYRYDRVVSLGPHVVRLRPAPHCRTPIISYSLKVQPEKNFVNWQQDPFSNYLARVMFVERTDRLEAQVELVAEMAVFNPFDFFLEPAAEFYPFSYGPELAHDLAPYLNKEVTDSSFERFFAELDRSKQGLVDFLVGLNGRLQNEIEYQVRMKPGVQSPEETLSKRSGSCRDSAWLLCQLLRSCGIAARFASGYLIQLKAADGADEQSAGAESDCADLHAWTEAYLPGAGWIGFDPTSGLVAGQGHIPLACTPEPSSAAPITGTTERCEARFDFEISLRRIYESPSVSKPYAKKDWEEILVLGNRVEEELNARDVRLTLGVKPTFVSIDHMDAAEWKADVLGATKRELAGQLARRLQARFAPGGFLHLGQSKSQGGELRWELRCFWRKDGVPVWEDANLIADEQTDYQVSAHDSALFAEALASRLAVDTKCVMPVYESVFGEICEKQAPLGNLDSLQRQREEDLNRSELTQISELRHEVVLGYVLPIKRQDTEHGAAWVTESWCPRSGKVYVAPGDSPLGFRLPVDSVSPSDDPVPGERDPSAEAPPLPPRQSRDPQSYFHSGIPRDYRKSSNKRGMQQVSALQSREDFTEKNPFAGFIPQIARFVPHHVRTALVVEPRAGKLNVFMPQLPDLGEYLALVEVVEETSGYLGMPVLVEGYPPPSDPRVNVINVAPGSGVIEVNMQTANSWRESVDITTGVYLNARETRLGTERFTVDGREGGTGGGNHFLVGGTTPLESPFLRRPDLLRSLVSYWHNHPSLSYLFSGSFVGSMCESPRVDEAAHDALDELEIAFSRIPDEGSVAPSLVDRIFRHVLVNLTGSTHRAEFCIDKLYPPTGCSKRRGLVELRAFEMPPHEQMSLALQLLLRALIAHFWERPYRRSLVRWGTELHDRFLLPHYVWQDFEDVITDLNEAGYPFRSPWFAPHFEFHFPPVGEVNYRGTTIELRRALEPWHVLEEEDSSGATVRYVDSSLERQQVKVSGLVRSRYDILCNGLLVPLHATGIAGEYVGGVRYRAWQPAHCLHPTIGVHTPLVFELYDNWNGKAVAGCTYHTSHPGGPNPTTLPINAFEAESRRLARFSSHGHAGRRLEVRPALETNGCRFTLDLRACKDLSPNQS